MGTNTPSLTTSFLTPNNHDPLMDGDIIQHVSVKRDLLDVLAAKTNSQTGMIFKGDVCITPTIRVPIESFVKPNTYVRHLDCVRDRVFYEKVQHTLLWLQQENSTAHNSKWIFFTYSVLGFEHHWQRRSVHQLNVPYLSEFVQIA